MYDYRAQLVDTGLALTDQSFHRYFLNSLPPSLDHFVMFYDDPTFDVDTLCQRFVRWEARRELRGNKFDNIQGLSGGSLALFGQQSSTSKGKERQKRDMSEITCYGCGQKGHISRYCPNRKKGKGKGRGGKQTNDTAKTDAPKTEAMQPAKQPLNAVFTAVVNSSMGLDALTESFYVDSGALAHLVPSKVGLRNYVDFATPLEIAAANNGKIFAYSSGTARVSTVNDGVERMADIRDVYYVLGVHVRLLSLGKLESQGWTVCLKDGGMELLDRSGDRFAFVGRVNNVYPVKLAIVLQDSGFTVWMEEGAGPTHQEVIKRLDNIALVATAKGGQGSPVSLMTWHRRLGHPSFGAVIDLSKSGVCGMEIKDVPLTVPSLDSCAACVAGKSVHLPHKVGRTRATEFLERVHIDIAGPMPTPSVGGRRYLYVVVDDYLRGVYTHPLRLRSEAFEAFKIFKASVETELGKKICEVMTDNTGELSMGEMKVFCKSAGIKISTMVLYHPASNGVVE